LQLVVPEFEKQSGHKDERKRDTVGALTKLIEGGETFDLCVLTPAAIDDNAPTAAQTHASFTIVRGAPHSVRPRGSGGPDLETFESIAR